MSATTPNMITPIDDQELEMNGPVTAEVCRKFAQNCNYLLKFNVVGSYRPWAQFNEVDIPDPNCFAYCDGQSEIDSQSSAAFNGFPPQFEDVYPIGAESAASNGTNYTVPSPISGETVSPPVSLTNALAHAHTGATQPAFLPQPEDSGSDANTTPTGHTHPINTDLDPTQPIEPYHFSVGMYIKIA